jgi:hypothetical protein
MLGALHFSGRRRSNLDLTPLNDPQQVRNPQIKVGYIVVHLLLIVLRYSQVFEVWNAGTNLSGPHLSQSRLLNSFFGLNPED